jgi:hemoglobin
LITGVLMHEIVDRVNINEMVREFYASVLQDELLSPFFIRALGDDLKNGKWHEHLHTLDNFWLLIMTGKKRLWRGSFSSTCFFRTFIS